MKYYTDGFMIGKNPSTLGGGYTIVDEDNNLIRREVIERIGYTNNEAELKGVLETLKICKEEDQVSTDSMCILSWVHAGRSKVRPDLNQMMAEAQELKLRKNVNLMWERRDFNLAGRLNETQQKKRTKLYYESKKFHQKSLDGAPSVVSETDINKIKNQLDFSF